jgi:chromosome segregation ATPase
LETKVKEANSESKKITDKAINLIKDMGTWAQNLVMQLQIQINSIVRENELRKKWNETKEKFVELFEKRQDIQMKRGSVETDLQVLQNVKNDVEMVIEQGRETISTIEKSIRQKEELERRRKIMAERQKMRNKEKHKQIERNRDYGIER